MISPDGGGSKLGAGRRACHIRTMAEKDKTKAGDRNPGGKPNRAAPGKTEPMATGDKGADKDSAKNGAPRPEAPEPDPARPDPTRYGDWEINGRCIDF